MIWLYESMKWTHIVAGIIALVFAPIAMAVQKGGAAHRRWGKTYFWAMAAIFVTALVMLLFRTNMVLLAVSVLSFYLALSGYRALGQKRPQQRFAEQLDWAAVLAALGTGLAVLAWGIARVSGGLGEDPTPVLAIIFSVLITLQAISDIRLFRNPPADKNHWWFRHMDGMVGSYIGTTTAFLVQTVAPRLMQAGVPPYLVTLVWVLPAMVGSPALALWVGYYRRRFSQKQADRATTP